ncbi:hypothetical protein NQ314_000402 [Rhamnusium bicolor]|uniref:Uncharacterized protein n=1 Tax=Rhamnusium bicolor TaxID=1586634 RepID=A0AAV8ZVF9_9CUCU|nr:hypothetical protein NQ314_000402 [Rhamnusium bicolor]
MRIMGGVSSKSPLERRNTVARRSQRRSIHSIKAKVDKVFPDIKKFKGVEEDVNYNSLHAEIEHIKNELLRKAKDLQPQLKNIYDDTLIRIEEAFKALEDKLKENQEKALRKEKENQEKSEKKKDKKKKEENNIGSENNDVEVQEIQDEPNKEVEDLVQTTDKRKTVELKFVQVIPDEKVTEADIHNENNNRIIKSPEEKRKSILKVGIPVMTGAMMNEISAKSVSISRQYDNETYSESDSETIIAKVNDIIEHLQAIEYQIADFVGKKHGTQYSRIRDQLNHYLIALNRFNTSDDYTVEQIKICKNYVGSCLNFLDEKAIEEEKFHDDVFLPPNSNLGPIDARMKLDRLSKTTAI